LETASAISTHDFKLRHCAERCFWLIPARTTDAL
jgi:hypothetical protein